MCWTDEHKFDDDFFIIMVWGAPWWVLHWLRIARRVRLDIDQLHRACGLQRVTYMWPCSYGTMHFFTKSIMVMPCKIPHLHVNQGVGVARAVECNRNSLIAFHSWMARHKRLLICVELMMIGNGDRRRLRVMVRIRRTTNDDDDDDYGVLGWFKISFYSKPVIRLLV